MTTARDVGERILNWIEPEENPSAVVYGTIAAGLLIAAEEPSLESYATLVPATAVAVVLYWFAHAYASLLGQRFVARESPSVGQAGAALRHEWVIVKGATAPLLTLAVAWLWGADLEKAVTAALWVCVGALSVFEMVAAVRARLPVLQVVGSAVIGGLMGVGLLAVKYVLH